MPQNITVPTVGDVAAVRADSEVADANLQSQIDSLSARVATLEGASDPIPDPIPDPKPDPVPDPDPVPSGRVAYIDWSNGNVLGHPMLTSGAGNWRNSMRVVDAPAGFSTTKCLEQVGIAESGSWGQIHLTGLPEVGIGQTLRMSVEWQSPNPYGSVDNLLHGFEVLDPGNNPIGINSRYSGQRWQIEIDIPTAQVYADRGANGFGAFALTRTGVYKLVIEMERLSTSQMDVRVTLSDNATGDVIYGPNDWPSYYDPNAAPMHEAAPFSVNATGWQNLREWRMGINGIGNVDGQVVHRWGAWTFDLID